MKRITVLLSVLWVGLMLGFPAYAADPPKVTFVKKHACPSTGKHTVKCAGYAIGHVIPLCIEGKNAATNMEWQPIAEYRSRLKRERAFCACKRKGGTNCAYNFRPLSKPPGPTPHGESKP